MNWISNNLSESLIIAGLALLVIEVVVLGFSSFVLFFVGLAALAAGGLWPSALSPIQCSAHCPAWEY
jgi:membrane protein implicated in regulation of membrane protease activity